MVALTVITALLALVAGLAGPVEDLTLAAQKDAPEAVRMAAFDRLVDLGATDMAHVLKVSADDGADARERWVAVRVLGKIGGDRSREALLKLLEDDMPAMRVAAAGALGDLGDGLACKPLAARISDPALLVRGGAADAVGVLGCENAVEALSEAVFSRDNYHRGSSLWVRRHFVEALGQIGDKAALPTLLRALDDADPEVAGAAIGAMEGVARFSYSQGRSADQEREAWRRWATNELSGTR